MSTISCKKEDSGPAYDIMVKETSLGKILTDGKGMSLYFFTPDIDGVSTCTGGCLSAWPVFSATNTKFDPLLTASDFTTLTRADGKTQMAYKGWPLYYYAADKVAGDVTGENVGKKWFVAKTNYTIMLADKQLVGHDAKLYNALYKEGEAITQFFVDNKGRTLYGFAFDKNKVNKYTKADFSNDAVWPLYYADITELPSTIDKTLFSTIDVYGKKQLTYKGWPMYYFGQDNQTRGMTKGVSFPKAGVWPILNLDSPVAPAP